jgi:hypothetical protein
MKPVGLFAVVVAVIMSSLMGLPAQTPNAAPSPWEQPAAALAEQIAGILGPGQARLTIRNLSTIPNDEVPAIRLLLEQDLKAHGVLAADAESANSIRVTLSENQHERLWVAEVIEGSETRVAMVHVDSPVARTTTKQDRVVLRKERYLNDAGLSRWPDIPSDEQVLAMIGTNTGLAVLKQDQIVIIDMTLAGWMARKGFDLNRREQLPRDSRGIMIPSANGNGLTVFTARTACTGIHLPSNDKSTSPEDGWSVNCHESDDPWPILTANTPNGPVTIKAFYNAARNYFTGVVTPSLGVDLSPFYSAALVPRASGPALLIGGIDGKVQILEGTSLKPVSGTRDWGSDFATLNSGCGAGVLVIASGSGAAASDSLRAYDLPAQEAVAASAPLAMDGTVTALWAAPDGKSVYAVVRGAADQYEVDRVTASCN